MRTFYYLDTDFLNKPSEEIINGLITLFKHIKDKENITIIYSKKEMKGKLVKFLKSSENYQIHMEQITSIWTDERFNRLDIDDLEKFDFFNKSLKIKIIDEIFCLLNKKKKYEGCTNNSDEGPICLEKLESLDSIRNYCKSSEKERLNFADGIDIKGDESSKKEILKSIILRTIFGNDKLEIFEPFINGIFWKEELHKVKNVEWKFKLLKTDMCKKYYQQVDLKYLIKSLSVIIETLEIHNQLTGIQTLIDFYLPNHFSRKEREDEDIKWDKQLKDWIKDKVIEELENLNKTNNIKKIFNFFVVHNSMRDLEGSLRRRCMGNTKNCIIDTDKGLEILLKPGFSTLTLETKRIKEAAIKYKENRL